MRRQGLNNRKLG